MAKGFEATLRELREGETLAALSTALAQLVSDVMMSGKPGKLALTVTIKPLNKGGAHVLVLADEIKVTPPKPSVESTILYATDEHELTRKDPRQPELSGLREIRSKESVS